MGMLVDGRWNTRDRITDERGRYVREPAAFRCELGPTGAAARQVGADAGRYRLYVSYACPWAHRTLLMRTAKRLDAAVGIRVVHPVWGEQGWRLDPAPGVADEPTDLRYLHQIYTRARPGYTGRVTVPVLWDTRDQTIVCNESREIIRILDRELDHLGDGSVHFFPEGREAEVDAMIDANYGPVNNGVYRAGFAKSQEAHEEAIGQLFARLDELEHLLSRQHFLCGDAITAADWCLFTTLYRFDAAYYVHFKCNVRRIVDYPALWQYVRRLYSKRGVAATCRMDHIKQHYYLSHPWLNPSRLVPVGPDIDFSGV